MDHKCSNSNSKKILNSCDKKPNSISVLNMLTLTNISWILVLCSLQVCETYKRSCRTGNFFRLLEES